MKEQLSPRSMAGTRRLLPVLGGVVLLLAVLAFFMRGLFTSGNHSQTTMDSSSSQISAGETFREDGAVVFSADEGKRQVSIAVEIADNERSQTQGLMGRTQLGEDHGMLFLFDHSEPRSFWMANTPLPLDIVFIDSAYRIVKIHRNTRPFSEESLESGEAAKYVVEVNGGFADRHGISEGDRFTWTRR